MSQVVQLGGSPSKTVQYDPIYNPDMRLPEGFTCKDCYAFKRFCGPLGITQADRATCDYYPVRFHVSLERAQELNKLAQASEVVS